MGIKHGIGQGITSIGQGITMGIKHGTGVPWVPWYLGPRAVPPGCPQGYHPGIRVPA